MTDPTLSFRVDHDTSQYIEQLADEHDATKSDISRALIIAGYRAAKYYPEHFAIEDGLAEVRR